MEAHRPSGRGAQRGEGHRDVLGAVDEVGLQTLHLAVEVDVGHPLEYSIEHHLDLHPGQVGPETEVGATSTEGDVGVGTAGDVEGSRVVEGFFVPVG